MIVTKIIGVSSVGTKIMYRVKCQWRGGPVLVTLQQAKVDFYQYRVVKARQKLSSGSGVDDTTMTQVRTYRNQLVSTI